MYSNIITKKTKKVYFIKATIANSNLILRNDGLFEFADIIDDKNIKFFNSYIDALMDDKNLLDNPSITIESKYILEK